MKTIFSFFLAIVLCSFLNAQSTITLDSTTLTEREVAIGIQVPWEILWGPDDHVWVTEKRGRVLRIDPENGNIETILNIQADVESGAEPGLLGMAIDNDFETNGKVYLAYTYLNQNFQIREKLVSVEWNGSQLINQTDILININGGNIHNGSRLLMTPDNKILMTTGDVGSGSNSQNMGNLSGKILRINTDGSIPEDNPIPDSYIYSYGHRNQQGLAYGPNGNLYASEHGAQSSDEFNLILPNRNYGWPNVQGACNTTAEINFCEANNVREPLIEWTPCVAVNGIVYYDQPQIPEWEGKMLMAVLGGFVADPRISVLEFNGSGTEVVSEERYFENYGRLRDICVNPNNGAIYFATNGFFYPSSGPNMIIEYRNLDFNTSNTNLEPSDRFIKTYPNPVQNSGVLSIECSSNFRDATYELISFEGRVVRQGVIKSENFTIDLENLSAGNYYLKASNQLGMITKKIIIQ